MSLRNLIERIASKIGLRDEWDNVLARYAMRSSLIRQIPRRGSRIVQVVGTPRSGTTLLSAMLDSHTRAICLIEPYLGWLKYGKVEYDWDRLNLSSSAFSRKRPDRLFDHLCRDERFRVVGFKETFRTSWHPTYPTQSFLQSNFEHGVDETIAIVRDPRDTWSSVICRHPQLKENTTLLAELVHGWNELCTWISEDGVPFVRYERLVMNTRQTIAGPLGDFGLGMESSVLYPRGTTGHGDQRAQSESQIDDSSVGTYKEVLEPEDCRFIEAQCHDHLLSYGYK